MADMVDDLADGCIFIMTHYSDEGFLNIGTGREVNTAEFARLVAEIVGYRVELVFDTSRPDGPPRKPLDISKVTAFGWTAKTPLREGLRAAYKDFLARASRCVNGNVLRCARPRFDCGGPSFYNAWLATA